MAFPQLNQTQIAKLMSLKAEDITLQLLRDLFAHNKDNKVFMDPNGRFMLSNSMLEDKSVPPIKGSEAIETSAGRYIANMFLLEKLKSLFNYINKPFDGGTLNFIQKQMAIYMLEDKLAPEIFEDYINREQWLGYGMTSFIMPSMDMSIIKPLPGVTKRKKELYEQKKAAIAKKDVNTIMAIENELLELAKKELTAKDTPGMRIYESGGRGSFGKCCPIL